MSDFEVPDALILDPAYAELIQAARAAVEGRPLTAAVLIGLARARFVRFLEELEAMQHTLIELAEAQDTATAGELAQSPELSQVAAAQGVPSDKGSSEQVTGSGRGLDTRPRVGPRPFLSRTKGEA